MKAMIHDYRNRPGEHCGSTAMRNLIQHYCGLDLPEAVVFGLGSGLDFLLLESEKIEPALLLFGRSVSMETDLAAALGIDYRERPEADDDEAWQRVRAEVAQGRPTMLSGDAYYLTYRDFRVHFPSHRFVLLGFDDAEQVAIVADRLDPEPQRCSYRALRLSRNPPSFISTRNLWGKFHDTRVGRSMEAAYASAIQANARRMLGSEASGPSPSEANPDLQFSRGLSGLSELARQLPEWPRRDDLELLASYASQCIEKFGTGGGNFRTLYAAFLHEARAVVPSLVDTEAPDLAARSSARWTELSRYLKELGVSRSPDVAARCRDAVTEILALETRLFESLAERSAA